MSSSAWRIRTAARYPGLVVLVVADHVAHVLAQPALDALAELLAARDVDLRHAVLAGARSAGGAKDETAAPCVVEHTSVTRSRITGNVRNSVTVTGPPATRTVVSYT